MKKFFSALFAVIFAVCSFSAASAENRAALPAREGVGMNISGFDTTDLMGNTVTSDILQDTDITIINYWATWCAPCCEELPYFQSLHEYYSETTETDVQIIGVIKETGGCNPYSAQEFLDEHGYTWLNIRRDSIIGAVLDTSIYVPQTLVIDRTGAVRDHIIGSFPDTASLQEVIEMWHDAITNHEGEMCTVTYVNGVTGEIIETKEAMYGYPMPEAPVPPQVEGHTFLEWEYDDNCYESGYEITRFAMGDVTVTAAYKAEKHIVRFYDGVDGALLKKEKVPYGQSANPPVHPEHAGYVFIGWDADYSCVTEDMEIHGICIPKETPLTGDIDGNGVVAIPDTILALRYAMGLITLTDEQILCGDIDGNGTVTVSDAILILRIAMGI